jgi:peroxiredoxin
MDSIQEKYQQDGLVVIAVNLDREQQQAKRFLAEHSPKFHVAFDQQGETPKAYQLKGMPTSYLIDRNGRIISTHIGFNNSKKNHYENMIIQAIQSSTPDYSLKKEGKPQ